MPRLPPITLGPVFVTPAPAKTAKLSAVPRPTRDSAAAACVDATKMVAPKSAEARETLTIARFRWERMRRSVDASRAHDESHPH